MTVNTRSFFVVAVLAAALLPAPAEPCTTILVGKALTADGSVIHAHNEDMGNDAVGRLWAVAPSGHRPGENLEVPYVQLPHAESTHGYWASGNVLRLSPSGGTQGTSGLGTSEQIRPYDSVLVGLNREGVSMSCNWAYSKEENREGEGIRRYAIRQLLLERARNARQGIEILGGLIETYGQADWGGLIYHLADPEEAWVVETTTHNWVARRLRDDEIRVTANRFRIGSDYDLSSKTLVADAIANGWLASPDAELDFARIYGRPGKMDQPYDSRREQRAMDLLQAKAGAVTPDDLFTVLRDRYEGTEHFTPPQPGPVWREDLDANPSLSRTISTNLAQSTFVAHLRGDLPVPVGAVMWLGLATPSYAGYVPLYAGGVAPRGDEWTSPLPVEFSSSALEESDDSAWWVFRHLQRAADLDYARDYPVIRDFWSSRHAVAVERQSQIEAGAMALLEAGEERRAAEVLSAFTFSQAADTLQRGRALLQRLVPPADNQQVRGRGEGKDQWWDALPRAAWSEFEQVGHDVTSDQPWFEVYRIRPGVLAIYEPGQFEEVISYLIVGSEKALLFDTGLGIGDIEKLVSKLTDRDVVVLNSHTHYDHVGGNYAFDTVYGTGLEYTRAHELGRPHDEVAEFVGEGWIWKDTPAGFTAGGYVSRPFSISHRVEDGEVISLGDVELEVLLTPGHAPDSLCLLDRRRRLLFTGDTFYPATLYAHLPGSTFGDYQKTAGRLAGLAAAVDVVLPAHNEPTLPASELIALRDAFEAMPAGETPYVLTDGNREYDFGRFSILVSEPPPWESE